MEYQEFGSSDIGSVHREQRTSAPSGVRRMLTYVLYAVLLLVVLILLLVTGIKCTDINTKTLTILILSPNAVSAYLTVSQVNKDIREVKLHLDSIRVATSSASTGAAPVPDVPVQEITPVKGSCRDGWASFQRKCYLLSTTAVTWREAEEQCQAHRAHLLVINNVEELDYISGIVVIHNQYWIGLVEREHEGHWSWVDGTDFSSTPTFWDNGQPDDWDYRENGEDCGQLHPSGHRKRKMWNDADCKLRFNYICEASA